FGRTDPAFGHDIGFYVYWLPVIRLVVNGMFWALMLSTVATIIARYDDMHSKGVFHRKDVDFWAKASLFSPPWMRFIWDLEGWTVAVFLIMLRYWLLFKDNEQAGVRIGAQYLDLVGLFSTVNYIYV